jgi:hypothetical protein
VVAVDGNDTSEFHCLCLEWRLPVVMAGKYTDIPFRHLSDFLLSVAGFIVTEHAFCLGGRYKFEESHPP